MNTSLPEIVAFVVEAVGCSPSEIQADSDLFLCGVDGDDFFELIAKFERQFSISMAGYRWYFHHGEEGFLTPGRLLFPPPYKRVGRIPITPRLLHQTVARGRWPITYPAHQLPHQRLDVLTDQLLFGAIGLFGLALLLREFWH
ncbi:phosphopantetheine-binding protein [Acidovorax sp.]|uniref:phosphopantetheine-binding protein n=1 Tax=Acidovorax sp. TaxID=1872122 RepID=UPI003918F530